MAAHITSQIVALTSHSKKKKKKQVPSWLRQKHVKHWEQDLLAIYRLLHIPFFLANPSNVIVLACTYMALFTKGTAAYPRAARLIGWVSGAPWLDVSPSCTRVGWWKKMPRHPRSLSSLLSWLRWRVFRELFPKLNVLKLFHCKVLTVRIYRYSPKS